MRMKTPSLLSLLVVLALPSTGRASEPAAWRPGAVVESDLGVLLMSGGTGLFAGPTLGPMRLGLGFYRFDSPFRFLSGAPEGFELQVDLLLSADLTWHFLRDGTEGPYLRVLGQWKQQRVENRDNGTRANLRSVVLGPEVGWVFRLYRGLYLAPRVGVLPYLQPPQPGNAPVEIGGRLYDNPKHKTVDVFATLGLGYAW